MVMEGLTALGQASYIIVKLLPASVSSSSAIELTPCAQMTIQSVAIGLREEVQNVIFRVACCI